MPRRRSIQWSERPFWKQTVRHGTRRDQAFTAERTRRTVCGSGDAGSRSGAEAAAATRRNGSSAMASEASARVASASASSSQSAALRLERVDLVAGAAMARRYRRAHERGKLLFGGGLIA